MKLKEEGTYELSITNLNFNPLSEIVEVTGGEIIEKNFVLSRKFQTLKGATIKAYKKKGGEVALLMEQKKAIVIEEKIGAEEMSKKGAGNASAAVAKISGVAKNNSSEIGSIFVRGLGDRYLSTTLNGMLLPSESPELKNIDLSYFPSEVIQSMAVSKTYNKDILGDFGGAGININSKYHSGKPFFQVSAGSGFNTQAIQNDIKSVGMNSFGSMANQDLHTNDINKFVYEDVNWSPIIRSTPYLNNSFGISGGAMKKGESTSLSLFGTLGYSSDYSFRKGYSAFIGATGAPIQEYSDAQKSSLNVNKEAMFNARLNSVDGHELGLVLMHINNSSDEVNTYFGFNSDVDPDNNTYITRGVQNQNILNVVQLLGKYKLNNNITIDGGVAFNRIDANQPQRITNIFVNKKGTDEYRISANAEADNNLFYQKSGENQIQFKGGANIKLNDKIELYVGANAISKSKDFNAFQYNFKPNTTPYGVYTPSNVGDFFTQSMYENGSNYSINFYRANNKANHYDGNIMNIGGVADVVFKATEDLTIFGGMKVESIQQEVGWDVRSVTSTNPSDVITKNYIKPLPYVNVKYALDKKSNLKFGASKTYTLPQFKELAPFLYESIISNSYGNPHLYASDNYNLDVKWETFPTNKELISANLFGKYITNPINKTIAPNSANEMTFANTGDYAMVVGLEIEARKKLFSIKKEDNIKQDLTAGLNFSYIYSVQELDADKMYQETEGWVSGNFTNNTVPLTGASPIILNADITYQADLGKNFKPRLTVVGNYFSDRLYTIGLFGMGDNYEKGFVTLDLISRTQITKNIDLGFSVRNILNPSIERYQETSSDAVYINNRFQTGRNFSLSFSYKFNKH